MADIIVFDLSKDEYLELSAKALAEGSAERSIGYLTKALELDERFSEASIRLAEIYANLGAHTMSNAVLFKALSLKPGEEAESRIFYTLANNFLTTGDIEVVSYYMRYFGDDFEISYHDGEGADFDPSIFTDGGFSVAYPKGDDYYEMLIDRAYSLIREKKFDEALKTAAQIDPRSKSAEGANHIVLVCYMMKNDIDRVIDTAADMLKENDSLAVRCTLATAYMMEEKTSKAHEVLDGILATDYTRMEDILMLLPILVNLEMHAEVVKYTKRVLENLDLQPNTMIWLSQGLYNIGQKEEALKVMYKVRTIYGDYSPAEYFIMLYKSEPPSVEYSMNLPYNERFARYRKIEEYIRYTKVDFEKALRYDAELTKLIRWAFLDGNEKIVFMLVTKLDACKTDFVRKLYKDVLIMPELSFDLMSRLVASLLDGGYTLDLDVVAQDRYKEVFLALPEAYYKLPSIFRDAVWYCICDIIFTDEDPSTYIERLRALINELVAANDEGELRWKSRNVEKVGRLRSLRGLVGVLQSKVYFDDPSPVEDSMDRYELSRRTFDKYHKILFGDDDKE